MFVYISIPTVKAIRRVYIGGRAGGCQGSHFSVFMDVVVVVEICVFHRASFVFLISDLAYNIALCHYSLKQYAPALKYIREIIEHGIQEHPGLPACL